MNDELVKRLRNCATQAAPCLTCDMTDDGSCIETLMKQAADAIEELTGFVQEAERDRDEYRERLDKANDAIEELGRLNAEITRRELKLRMEKPRWIPVTERLPKYGDLVLGIGPKKGYYVCEYRGISHFVYGGDSPWFSAKGRAITVTHWMPLPQPPKEE